MVITAPSTPVFHCPIAAGWSIPSHGCLTVLHTTIGCFREFFVQVLSSAFQKFYGHDKRSGFYSHRSTYTLSMPKVCLSSGLFGQNNCSEMTNKLHITNILLYLSDSSALQHF